MICRLKLWERANIYHAKRKLTNELANQSGRLHSNRGLSEYVWGILIVSSYWEEEMFGSIALGYSAEAHSRSWEGPTADYGTRVEVVLSISLRRKSYTAI